MQAAAAAEISEHADVAAYARRFVFCRTAHLFDGHHLQVRDNARRLNGSQSGNQSGSHVDRDEPATSRVKANVTFVYVSGCVSHCRRRRHRRSGGSSSGGSNSGGSFFFFCIEARTRFVRLDRPGCASRVGGGDDGDRAAIAILCVRARSWLLVARRSGGRRAGRSAVFAILVVAAAYEHADKVFARSL